MRTHTKWACVAAGLIVLAAAFAWIGRRGAASTEVTALGGTCSACAIEIERIATLGDEEGDGAITNAIAVTHGEGSTYVVTDYHAIARFGADGEVVSQRARRGRGPGEFQGISSAIFANGELHVIDGHNYRYLVLGPDLDVLREAPLRQLRPNMLGLTVTSSGRTIVNGIPSGIGSNTPVLHEIDTAGNRLASFDSMNLPQERERGFANADRRNLTASQGDRVWAGREDDYVVSLWQIDPPREMTRITPRSSWFVRTPATKKQQAERESPVRKRPPPPAVMSLQEDSTGLLWITGRTTNDDWEEYADSRKGGSHEMFSGVIDVVDPNDNGQLIASVKLPFAGRFVAPGILGRYYEGSEGYPMIELYRVRLLGYSK